MPFYQSHSLHVCVCGLGVLKERLEIVLAPDDSVRIATCYGVEGPGIEFLSGWGFPHPCILALMPSQLPIQSLAVLFPGWKAAWEWRWPSTPSSAELKERVELYPYCPPGLSGLYSESEIYMEITSRMRCRNADTAREQEQDSPNVLQSLFVDMAFKG